MSTITVTPWCEAKHSTSSSSHCTCSKTPGHTDAHKCWGCGREWPNVPAEVTKT